MPPQHTILVADDDEMLRELVVITLALDGLTVLQAVDGAQALDIARRVVPDLALLDVMMPGVDGVGVCRALKADQATAGTRVVMLTAEAQQGQRERALEAGADAYLTKPFSPTALRDLITRLLAS